MAAGSYLPHRARLVHTIWITFTNLIFVAMKWIIIGHKAGRYPRRVFAAAAAAAQSQPNQQLDHPIIKRRWYGSKTIVEVEEQAIPGMQLIKPYLRSGLKTSDRTSTTHARDSEEFVISFLGTGGGSPTQHRLHAAIGWTDLPVRRHRGDAASVGIKPHNALEHHQNIHHARRSPLRPRPT